VYGPNAPSLLGGDGPPALTDDEMLLPPERFGVRVMSMDFLVGQDDPVIFRGPMVHKVLTQLVEDVQWGPLDYLVVDLPPGTGDTQLSVLQTLPVAGAVITTTPQAVAVDDGRKALQMFAKHDTPVLGVVENMTTFQCPDCGSAHELFGAGGGQTLAREGDLPLLGALPLDPAVRTASKPAVLADGTTADRFRSFVRTAADMQGLVHRQRESA
jgi:ATPases involved in chromosome partitioning